MIVWLNGCMVSTSFSVVRRVRSMSHMAWIGEIKLGMMMRNIN